MRMSLRRPAALAAAVAFLSTASFADRIYLADGKSLDDVTIVNETLAGVAYRAAGKSNEQTVQADQVLKVEYDKNVPNLLRGALEELKGESPSRFQDAASGLFDYADGVLNSGKKEKAAWAPAYALHRAIELNQALNSKASTEEVVKLADLLLSKCGDSRYVPYAYVAKANAQRDLGLAKEAGETVATLKEMVRTRAMSDAFRLQAELVEVELSAAKSNQKRDRFIEIGGQAGTGHPIVRNRARVLEAQTYLESESKDYAKARKIYEAVIKDPKADDATLASAYLGMGDCLFQEGADKLRANGDASVVLKDAVLNYLRVVIVYEDQVRYVPKALYQAAKVFEFMGEANKPNARRMLSELVRNYPDSEWASQARNSRK